MSLPRSLILFVFLASLVLAPRVSAAPALAAGQTYYVSTTGSDGFTGSNAFPWRTIQYGADQLSPGDTLLIAPGTYQEAKGITVSKGGTPGKPVTFKASGPGVIIDKSGTLRDAFYITYADYVVVDGLIIQNATRAGVRIDHSAHVTVRNSVFANNQTWGLFTDFSDYTTVEDSESYGAKDQHGIYISNSSDYPVIRHNRLHDNAGCGLHMNGDISMQPGDGVISFGLVDGNVIYNNGLKGGSGINMDGVTDTIVRNNLLYDNRASGISAYQIDGGSGSKRDKILNNTILMPAGTRWPINIPEPDTSLPNWGNTGIQVSNNILYNADSWKGVITIGPSDLAGFSSDYNVLIDRLSADGEDDVISLAEWQAMGYDQHSFIALPPQLFVDPGAANFHLSPGSPARDKGAYLTNVPTDLDGVMRPANLVFDIGAYELPVLPAVVLPFKLYLPGVLQP